MTPLFTIITPTYNRPELLRRALASIAAQTFSSYEVIVVDDHSDPPAELPLDLGISRLRLIRHSSNRGPAAAYNSGIAAASGALISILDDDDELRPGFLAATARAFEAHPEADFSWCSVDVIDDGGAHGASSPTERRFRATYAKTEEEEMFLDALSIGNGFGFTVRANWYARLGGYDESFATAEDAEFIYRLLGAGARPVVVTEPLVIIHNHGELRRTSATHDAARAEDCERILQRHGDFIHRWPRVAAQLERHLQTLRGAE